ncbi:efflux RND transporter periplasmic adaptor subunit [Desulfobacter vibrioformis]|uniref:efflux RND transporter periplasmic adaptor subunit n=1 Tax=Desulfobacter vibrioformis TaxID=34031 RepID=UPI00068AE4FD|nr:efflux RND transporter periplasmic adaptor subunit [Desulfobacter vibrioformis]
MSDTPQKLTFFGNAIKFFIPLLIIAGGAGAWFYFQSTAPVMKKATPAREVTMVETQAAQVGEKRVLITAMGTVKASREVTLKAQVSGMVQSVSDRFTPGSLVPKGEALLQIDPLDYQVAVKKAQSALDHAKAALAIEQGSQNIAKEEIKVLSEMTRRTIKKTDLALRKPQLAQAQADVTGAEADLIQARLDLSRTRICAPFNSIILDRSVNEGAYVGTQEDLVTLAGADEFWIEAVVPLDQMTYIDLDIPGGSPVTIRSQSGPGTWQGRVIQAKAQLSDSSRMATVIIAVQNPLGIRDHISGQPLMLNDYVNVEISGRTLDNVVQLPRSALKDNDTVWVNTNNTLDIRKVSLAWKGTDHIYIKTGLDQGDQVVVSSLSTPVQGMAVKTFETTEQEPAKIGEFTPAPSDNKRDPS